MNNKLLAVKASTFITDPAYSQFLYLNTIIIDDLMDKLINETDKDKVIYLQKQIQILKALPELIKAKAQYGDSEQD